MTIDILKLEARLGFRHQQQMLYGCTFEDVAWAEETRCAGTISHTPLNGDTRVCPAKPTKGINLKRLKIKLKQTKGIKLNQGIKENCMKLNLQLISVHHLSSHLSDSRRIDKKSGLSWIPAMRLMSEETGCCPRSSPVR